MTSLAKFDVSRDDITRVVAHFYELVRQHPNLGPVFATHVHDWPAHEEKVANFWANAILNEKNYSGNPVLVHQQAGNVRPGMFDPWLGLFDTVLKIELQPDQAEAWSALAHRIGASLRAGVTERFRPGNVPILK